MKNLIISSLVVIAGFQVQAAEEIWNCRSVIYDIKAQIVDGRLVQASLTASGEGTIELKNADARSSKVNSLIGETEMGHDYTSYKIEMIRGQQMDANTAQGQLSLSYSGYQDCVGNVSGSDTVSCTVELKDRSTSLQAQ